MSICPRCSSCKTVMIAAPVPLRIMTMTQTQRESQSRYKGLHGLALCPSDLALSPVFSLPSSATALRPHVLYHKHPKQTPTSGPLHLLFLQTVSHMAHFLLSNAALTRRLSEAFLTTLCETASHIHKPPHPPSLSSTACITF